MKMVEKGASGRKEEVVTREYTINLHKRLHGWFFDVSKANAKRSYRLIQVVLFYIYMLATNEQQ
ncbi:60S ribosomal protein L31, variant 3 [Lathyrus oleraceus]|uniref:60S ribosomal protein L31, variant 3 n=1 Tax=Pisum sativum TaxID=3888 RepID=A0A9D4W8Y2_PEA|nr:60S ribosomal protein L31, variant 3 [Pisum sativum]